MSTGRAHPPLPVLPQRHGFSRSCLTHSPVHCQAGVGWIGGIRTYVCKLDGIVTESKCVCVCVCVCVCEREREAQRKGIRSGQANLPKNINYTYMCMVIVLHKFIVNCYKTISACYCGIVLRF